MSDILSSSSPDAAVPWLLVAGFLALLMRAGLALVMSGLNRAKNAAHTMAMNLMGAALATLGFFVCGYAFLCCGGNQPVFGPGQFSGQAPHLHVLALRLGDHSFNVLGLHGFCLSNQPNGLQAAWFILMAALIATAAGIPAGALAERWRFLSLCLYSLIAGAIIHPILGAWTWGGGWLAQLGVHAGLGHGAVDFAGSAVIHLAGGTAALVGCFMLGPRIGKFDPHGRPKPIFAHQLPMAFVGTLLAALGWLGANTGAALASGDGSAGLIALNTLLASVAGASAACCFMWYRYGKPDPSLICSGLIAGLVAISASCPFLGPLAALLIGAIAGLLCCWGVVYLEQRKIDDPTGVIATHGLAGLWGTLALGLFANGAYGLDYNGINNGRGVSGLFHGDARQLAAQAVLVAATILWTAPAAFITFKIIGWWLDGNRVTSQVEIGGLDLNEMGVPAYPDFITTFNARNEPGEIPQLRRDVERTQVHSDAVKR